MDNNLVSTSPGQWYTWEIALNENGTTTFTVKRDGEVVGQVNEEASTTGSFEKVRLYTRDAFMDKASASFRDFRIEEIEETPEKDQPEDDGESSPPEESGDDNGGDGSEGSDSEPGGDGQKGSGGIVDAIIGFLKATFS